jgi:hypothetical protein
VLSLALGRSAPLVTVAGRGMRRLPPRRSLQSAPLTGVPRNLAARLAVDVSGPAASTPGRLVFNR